MKKIDNISDFEHLFKKEMSGHSTPPPADAWANVAASTAGQSAGILSQASSFLASASNVLKVALFAGGIAAVGIVIYTENVGPDVSTATTEITIPVDKKEQKREQTPDLQKVDVTTPGQNTQDTQDKSTQTSPKRKIEKAAKTTTPKTEVPKTPTKQEVTANKTPAPIADNTNEVLIDTKPLYFEISNPKPCLGDKITLHSQKAGSWYQDSELLATNVKTITTTVTKKGATLLSLIIRDTKTSKTIDVQGSEAQIVSAKQGNKHFFSLTEKSQIANWYIDDKLIVTNAKECTNALTQVGEHTIRAVVTNSSCTAPASITVTTKPIGSIRIYNIITIDGDGKNDEYDVEIDGYENYSIQIFDLENTLIFYANEPANKWNGRLFNEGTECPAGSYVAKISFTLIGEAPTTKNIKLTLKRP
jgi:hypothetical protein